MTIELVGFLFLIAYAIWLPLYLRKRFPQEKNTMHSTGMAIDL